MTIGEHKGPDGTELPLLPSQGDIIFATGDGKKIILLRYSGWSRRKIIFSREVLEKIKGEIWMSVSLGDFHRPWEAIRGRVEENTFIVESQSHFLEDLYNNQGSVSKTLNMKGGPLDTGRQRRSGRFRSLIIAVLVLVVVGFLVSFGVYKSQYHAALLENKTQATELTKSVNRERIRVSGHEKQKEALGKEILAISEQYRAALARQARLQDLMEKGLAKDLDLYQATLQTSTLSLQREEKRREITRLNDELVAWEQLLTEQKMLREQAETLATSSYWSWVKDYLSSLF